MRIIGHRGASAVAPENTLRAVRTALASGMGVEVDLQLSRDGEVIILHDDTLWRTAAPQQSSWSTWLTSGATGRSSVLRRPVGELDLRALREIEVGDASHTERVPTFIE
eukprot:1667312-Prymnesium_polylepis.1